MRSTMFLAFYAAAMYFANYAGENANNIRNAGLYFLLASGLYFIGEQIGREKK